MILGNIFSYAAYQQEGLPVPKKPFTSLTIDTHVRCRQIFPQEKAAAYKELETMGVRLSREEALHLARAILAATQEWRKWNWWCIASINVNPIIPISSQ